MKSLIHEASTVAKAIEQGWIKAGKPKDFTVKIYEEPETNFLGFTKKNAKIGIFFSERPHGTHGRDGGRRPQKHMPQRRRFRHRRDDDRRGDDRRGGDYRGGGESREKWYKPQEDQRQDGHQRHDGQQRQHDERRHDEQQRPSEGQRHNQQQRPHHEPHTPPFHHNDDDKDQS